MATTRTCIGSSKKKAGRASGTPRPRTPGSIAPDHKAVIGYDDAESVAFKTEWAMKQGFRGVFFWQIAADLMPDDTNPLQEASRAKLDASPAHGFPPDRRLLLRTGNLMHKFDQIPYVVNRRLLRGFHAPG